MTLIINLNWNNSNLTCERRNYHKADYESIISFLLDIKWEEELRGLNTNEMWQKIKDQIHKAVDKFIPVTKQGNQKTKKWMDKKTLETVRKKKRLWRLWKKTEKDADHQKYLQANNQASRACKKAQRRLEKDVAEKSKTDPKANHLTKPTLIGFSNRFSGY